jgi:hypothetical protein
MNNALLKPRERCGRIKGGGEGLALATIDYRCNVCANPSYIKGSNPLFAIRANANYYLFLTEGSKAHS